MVLASVRVSCILARILVPLRHLAGEHPIVGVGVGPQKNAGKRHRGLAAPGLLWKGTWSQFRKLLPQDWRGQVFRRVLEWDLWCQLGVVPWRREPTSLG